IQDEAVKCRYCQSDLAAAEGSSVPAEPPRPLASGSESPPSGAESRSPEARPGEGAVRFSHSGFRYVLGYGRDFFGIWGRHKPGGPIMRFPRTDEGWSMAWNRFTAWEPKAIEVPLTGTAPPDVRVSTGTFRSGKTRATWAVWLLGIIAALTVVGFSFRLMELDLLKRQERGEVISRSEAEANDHPGAAMVLAT